MFTPYTARRALMITLEQEIMRTIQVLEHVNPTMYSKAQAQIDIQVARQLLERLQQWETEISATNP